MPKPTLTMAMIALILIVFPVVKSAQNVVWQIDTCRITTLADGTFQLCQEQGQCATQTEGSQVNCSTYTYKTVGNITDCISKCCYDLNPVPEALTGPLVQECYDQAQFRHRLYIGKILAIVFGIIFLIVGIGAFFIFGFVKNPYTGERSWVGCLCCRKVPDFQRDRNQQMKSLQVIKKEQEAAKEFNVMDLNEKKMRTVQLKYKQ